MELMHYRSFTIRNNLQLCTVLTSRNDWEPLSRAPVATSSQTPLSCRAATTNNQTAPEYLFTYSLKQPITFTVSNQRNPSCYITCCVCPLNRAYAFAHDFSLGFFFFLFAHADLLITSVILLTAAV